VLGIGVGRAEVTMVSLLEGTPTRLPGSPASVYLRSARQQRAPAPPAARKGAQRKPSPVSAPAPFVTKTSRSLAESSCERDAGAAKVAAMDVVAIVLGLAMFAILLMLIEGIDRV
jgi:hypothetical protein